jgi:ribA/ribD-fused uncharacterized protein
MENVNVDMEESETDQFQQLGAFVNLRTYGFENHSGAEIAKSVKQENPPQMVPLFILKDNRFSLRFICANEKVRNDIVENGINIFSRKVTVEKPRSPTRLRTIYIYGLPIFEKTEKIEQFLKNRLNLNIKSEFRWMCYPGSDVRNGGRSISVEAASDVEIPGFIDYVSDAYPKPRKISIWYPDLPVYCRSCYQKGHTSDNCTKKWKENTETSGYANAAKYGKSTGPKAPDVPKPTNAENLPMETLTGESATVRTRQYTPVNRESESQAGYGNITTNNSNIFPFFSKNDILSNHFECHFKIDEIAYDCTEQFLFSEKAIARDQPHVAKSIMHNRQGRYAKKFGEQVAWNDTLESWLDFAKEKLIISNRAKYTQNKDLRQHLFSTAPKDLVEANPTDVYWGVALRKTDPRIYDKNRWKGQNLMGQLLTDLREELMANPLYADEISSNWTTVKNKRQRESPDNPAQKRLLTM